MGVLVAGHVDAITATDSTLEVTVAGFQTAETALQSGSFTLTNAAQLSDAGSAIAGLSAAEIGQLAGDNIGSLFATGDLDLTRPRSAH